MAEIQHIEFVGSTNSELAMIKKLNMDGEQYRELLKMLNEEIYKYSKHQGIDLNAKEKLIEVCNVMKK